MILYSIQNKSFSPFHSLKFVLSMILVLGIFLASRPCEKVHIKKEGTFKSAVGSRHERTISCSATLELLVTERKYTLQLSVVSCQLSVVSCQLYTLQLSVVGFLHSNKNITQPSDSILSLGQRSNGPVKLLRMKKRLSCV